MLKIKVFNLLFCIALYSLLSASEIQVLDYTTLDCLEVRSFISQSWNLCKLTGFAQYQLGYSYVCEGKHPLHTESVEEKRFISG